MATKICAECGKSFETKSSRKIYCDNVHERVCKCCGKVFKVTLKDISKGTNKQYCSAECRNSGRSNSLKSATFQCVCKVCGTCFSGSSVHSTICDSCKYLTCKVCGTIFEATSDQMRSGLQTCSNKCRYKLAQATYQHNYGSAQNPDNHKTMVDKHAETMRKRYNVDNPMQVAQFQARAIDTKRKKYGDDLSQISEKIQATTEARYGSKFLMQIPEFKNKAKRTCEEKYGVDNYAKSFEFLLMTITDPNKASDCLSFKSNPREYILSKFSTKPTLAELASCCGISESSVGYILDKADASDAVQYVFSRMEDEVYQFLLTVLDEDALIVRNTRKIIPPYELDIYIPKYNLAIECNPTSTHNSTYGGWDTQEPKSRSYHKMKTDMCEHQGIFLFHLFGDEWTHKRPVIESMLRNLLGHISNKVYARKTIVREVKEYESSTFLQHNHRQGNARSRIRLGLYYEDELVSLMTFSKMRNTIGKTKEDENTYELVRFCNKLNTCVVGGASKLFNYFINNYRCSRVKSFSDRAHTRGKLYATLGFVPSEPSDPGYVWISYKTDMRYSRNNAQKSNIRKFLHDDTIDLTKTETQIMKEHGYVQMFDSGTILWTWNRYLD